LRVQPERASATCEGGLEGDRWALAANRKLEEQVTAMRVDVVRLMTNGGELSRFGDNLLVELDLSEQNLPAGTRLRIGSTLLEVTAKPHTGCKKFAARAGRQALAMTRDPRWLADRLRGIHLRVLQAGEITVGDIIVKL
jgi:MOSC domain-containing protein YiiM